ARASPPARNGTWWAWRPVPGSCSGGWRRRSSPPLYSPTASTSWPSPRWACGPGNWEPARRSPHNRPMGPDDMQEFDIAAPGGDGPGGPGEPSGLGWPSESSGLGWPSESSGPSGPNGPNEPSGSNRSPDTSGKGEPGEPGGRGRAGGPGRTGTPDEWAGHGGRGSGDGNAGAAAPREGRTTHLWRGPAFWACCAVVLILLGIVVVPPQETGVGPWGQVEDITTTPVPAWQYDSEGQIRAALMTHDALVLVMGERVAGVEIDSGEQLWSHPLDRGTCTTDGRNLVCADGGTHVVQRAADTGAQVGQVEASGAMAATRWSGDWFVLRDSDEGHDELVRVSGGETLWSTPVQA